MIRAARSFDSLVWAVWHTLAESPVCRGIAVAGLFGLAILAGYAYPVERHRMLLQAAILLAGGILALLWQGRSPFGGLALLLIVAVLAPIGVRGQWDICLPLALLLFAVWVAQPILWRRPLDLDFSPVVAATLAFMLVAVLSFAVGQYAWFPTDPAPMRAQVGALALFLASGGLFLVVGHHIGSIAHLERLTWLFVAAGALFVAAQFVNSFPGLASFNRISVPRSVGSLFWVWLVAMSLSQGLCNKQLPATVRLALVMIAALGLARGPLLAFSWASGWMPVWVTAGVVLLARFPRFTVGSALLLAAPVLLISSQVLDAVMEYESYSLATRLEAWSVILHLVEENPWLGYGPANYYHYTVLFPIRGWWVRFNSHNNYLDLLAQTGIIGLLAFLWFAFEAGRMTLKVWLRAAGGFPKAYALGALAGLIGSLAAGLLGDWIVPFAYNVGLPGFRSSLLFWFFLGGALAVTRLAVPAVAVVDVVLSERARLPQWSPVPSPKSLNPVAQ
jgi:hypothetical protein